MVARFDSLVALLKLGVAQSGSAFGLGPKGREFESLHRDQEIQKTHP